MSVVRNKLQEKYLYVDGCEIYKSELCRKKYENAKKIENNRFSEKSHG